jgi:hypothetical protein
MVMVGLRRGFTLRGDQYQERLVLYYNLDTIMAALVSSAVPLGLMSIFPMARGKEVE